MHGFREIYFWEDIRKNYKWHWLHRSVAENISFSQGMTHKHTMIFEANSSWITESQSRKPNWKIQGIINNTSKSL